MNDFLPEGYVAPETPSHCMEFAEGQNYFRALTPAIVGFEWWVEHAEGLKPVRVRTFAEVPEEFQSSGDEGKARHFWAFAVYNYQQKSIQVLVLRQQTIMRAIEAFSKNPQVGQPAKLRPDSREGQNRPGGAGCRVQRHPGAANARRPRRRRAC